MTTDAINYLEAFALGYAMSSKEAYARVMKEVPSWNGVFKGITGDLFKGVASTLKIEMDAAKPPIVSIIKALKQAEAKAMLLDLLPKLQKKLPLLTPDELDHLDKTIEELRCVKRKQSA